MALGAIIDPPPTAGDEHFRLSHKWSSSGVAKTKGAESTRRLTYTPVLDGLRALAVLAVFLRHYLEASFPGGLLGVDVFFVLSGFLITSLLLDEHEATGTIKLRWFYARRALRLYPALLVMLAAVAVGGIPHEPFIWRGIVVGATYTANWAYAVTFHLPAHLAHLWSLAEEEQFYLLWPLVLIAMLRRRWSTNRLIGVLIGVLAVVMVWRMVLWASGADDYRIFFAFDTHADGLLLGCIAGVCFTRERVEPLFRPGLTAAMIGSLSAVALLVMMRFPRTFTPTLTTPLNSLGGLGLLCGAYAYRQGIVGRALVLPPLVWLGRRSYAFYLWHLPIQLVVVEHVHAAVRYQVIVGFTVSIVITALSWRVVETPFLRQKERFEVFRYASNPG